MSHVTCLAAARHALLQRRGWDVERQGLMGAPRIRILVGDHYHISVERAVRILGLGTDALVRLPVDDRGQLSPSVLETALSTVGDCDPLVLLQAGEINTGAFDPFDELIPMVRAHNAWVHVDGAFGLWAATSPKYRHLLAGVEEADSWATDGHKWLNVPFDCGYAFVADSEAHQNAMSARASYLYQVECTRDPWDWNPEFSRRGRGFATYAAIRELGRDGIAALIERTCQHAFELVTQIGALPNAEVMWQPQLNQGLVRFFDPKPGATERDHDRFTDQVIAGIVASGEAFFGGTTWRGQRCMWVSVCNWRTNETDVQRAVAAVRGVLAR